MRTYVTTYLVGYKDDNDREEIITYAGPSRTQAFSFKVDDFGNHSVKVDVWALSWYVGTYGIGEEFSSDEWVLESSDLDDLESEVNSLRELLKVIKSMPQLSEILEEKQQILDELKKEI